MFTRLTIDVPTEKCGRCTRILLGALAPKRKTDMTGHNDDEYKREVSEAVTRGLASGHDEFAALVERCDGADPGMVDEARNKLASQPPEPSGKDRPGSDPRATARRLAANLPCLLPAPDPISSQWWFTLDTVETLAEFTHEVVGDGRPLFLGTPTVGFYFSHCYQTKSTILDADTDVISCLAELGETDCQHYDVADEPTESLLANYSTVVLDAPWYESLFRVFLRRARQFLGDSGHILCVLPSRLTRPGVIEERTRLISELLLSGYEIISLDRGRVRYRVPQFEARAYENIEGFYGRPWRGGDLLVLRVSETSTPLECSIEKPVQTETYARDPTQFRVFLRPDSEDSALDTWIRPIDEFSKTVSAQRGKASEVSIWATNKSGAKIKNIDVARTILTSWSSGLTRDETANKLRQFSEIMDAGQVVSQFESALQLWESSIVPKWRRTPEDLQHLRTLIVSDLASFPTDRDDDYESDGFRLGFQRDRDRVLWSHGLKTLANKTQVFPAEGYEHVRHRLTHSIEVMQLATTIARAFGLDEDLTEAGALAHDIGHTPFGHAGEHALDNTIKQISTKIGGFNHYEHGADVVRWLEDAYQSESAGGHPGLNLTYETIESVFKHMYHRGNQSLGQSTLYEQSKHQDIMQNNSCHLEGQAVRIADKISYFISDLEDGIRMGVLALPHFRECRLFDRPPIDLTPSKDESLYQRFIAQRRAILQVLMEDVIVATDQRLGKVNSQLEVRNNPEYTVQFSNELLSEFEEVWNKIQKGILHRDPRVVTGNYRAGRIVSDLLLLYSCIPSLIDETFRRNHEKLTTTGYIRWYEKRLQRQYIGIPTTMVHTLNLARHLGQDLDKEGDNYMISASQLVMAKDFVASLTDARARAAHRHIVQGEKES